MGGWVGHSRGEGAPGAATQVREAHSILGTVAKSTSGLDSQLPLVAVRALERVAVDAELESQSGGDHMCPEKRLRPRSQVYLQTSAPACLTCPVLVHPPWVLHPTF